MKPSYRADIDGLRSIAVLPVIFFHFGVEAFSGGFVGVDVFFVISGYLITTIIVGEVNAGKFSILGFYDRRIRRIFPALFSVVLATTVLAIYLFSEKELVELSNGILATTTFASNIYFWTQSGYFDAPSELNPLLHTWSLAVEEQYYLFFPILIVLWSKYVKSNYALMIGALIVISFVASEYSLSSSSSASFYLIHSRAWELLLGSMIALNIVQAPENNTVRNLFSLFGITLIGYSVFSYSKNTIFPGSAALLPAVGAALVIFTGSKKTIVGKILSTTPLVSVGLISYSLYLWHWPVIVFAKYYLIRELEPLSIIIFICLTFILAFLSWRYVERPFRGKALLQGRSQTFTFAVALMTCFISLALLIEVTDGSITQSLEPTTSSAIDDDEREWDGWLACTRQARLAPLNPCDIGSDKEESTFFVWGDSHAQAIAPALHASALKNESGGKIATANRCPPLLGLDRTRKLAKASCHQFNQRVLLYLGQHPELETVFLSARWALAAAGNRYKNEAGKDVRLFDLYVKSSNRGTNERLFEKGIRRTINNLLNMERKVIVITQVPEVGYYVPSAVAVAQRTNRDANEIVAPTMEEYTARNKVVSRIFSAYYDNPRVEFIAPSRVLCDANRCDVVRMARPLYRDDDHLSPLGARLLSPIFDYVW